MFTDQVGLLVEQTGNDLSTVGESALGPLNAKTQELTFYKDC